jgi:hypothetical protein
MKQNCINGNQYNLDRLFIGPDSWMVSWVERRHTRFSSLKHCMNCLPRRSVLSSLYDRNPRNGNLQVVSNKNGPRNRVDTRPCERVRLSP